VGDPLKTLVGIIELIPGVGKTLCNILDPVFGSLLLAAEPNAANQFPMQAHAV
jgi:hypothetical protein